MSRDVPFRTKTRPGENCLPGCWLGQAAWFSGCVLIATVFAGCALLPRPVASLAPDYKPDNVFLYAPGLSPDVKRVALLPLASEDQPPALQNGCETLNPVVQAELIKTRKFEVVCASPEILRNCTGRSAWTGMEVLPQAFFESLREVYGCDAVLFCQLTAFRAYEPLAVGWRMKLVNARTGQTLWAVDELFDAAQQPVLKGARRYQMAGLQSPYDDRGDWLLRNSPRLFGQYAAAQVLKTIPKR